MLQQPPVNVLALCNCPENWAGNRDVVIPQRDCEKMIGRTSREQAAIAPPAAPL